MYCDMKLFFGLGLLELKAIFLLIQCQEKSSGISPADNFITREKRLLLEIVHEN